MPQSLSSVLLHLIFSTKNRQRFIDPAVESDLHAYLATVCKSTGCSPHKIGGADDHVHIACSLARTINVAELVQNLKQDSSKWIKGQGDAYRSFAWQNGYGAFSIGESQLPALRRYIANQREHHRRESFEEEFRKVLRKYGVEFDERYVWE